PAEEQPPEPLGGDLPDGRPPRLLRALQLPDGPLDAPRVSQAHGRGARAAEEEALARPGIAAAVVPGAGPRREEEQQASAVTAGDRMPLVRLERDERPRTGVELLPVALDAHLAVDDQDERVLLHLVLAEFLPRLEPDQHRAPLLLRVQHDRRDRAPRRLDR